MQPGGAGAGCAGRVPVREGADPPGCSQRSWVFVHFMSFQVRLNLTKGPHLKQSATASWPVVCLCK